MEYTDIYGVYIGQKESFIFMLPSFYEGSLQMERVDWSKLIEFEVSKLDKYITYMEWNVTKYAGYLELISFFHYKYL